MSTTFTQHHIVLAGKEMLAFSCRVPYGWHITPLPPDDYDFGNPLVFVPLLISMAPYGAVLLTIAARPKFDDGSVQDWAEYLCAQNNLMVMEMREARINRLPCVLCDATTESEMGVMRSRSLFLEDGGRLFNIQALAPRDIWPSVEGTFAQLLGSFVLDEQHGMTAPIMREMIAGDRIEFAFVEAAPAVAAEPERTASKETEVWTTPTSGEFAGQPGWWCKAVLLERDNKLDEAEQVIQRALDHIGVYSQLAYLYEERVTRLRKAGDTALAEQAKERAIHWLYAYAASATSGGEGAALSYERDQRVAALGGVVK